MYYVYLLLDPRKSYLPFYVGKGKNDRWKKHLTETRQTTHNLHKYNTIIAIQNAGLNITMIKWQENMTEDDAYDLEEKLILRFGRKIFDTDGILTNICISSRPPSQIGSIPWNKGKHDTYEEMYGKEKADDIKKKNKYFSKNILARKSYVCRS